MNNVSSFGMNSIFIVAWGIGGYDYEVFLVREVYFYDNQFEYPVVGVKGKVDSFMFLIRMVVPPLCVEFFLSNLWIS